MMGLCQEMYKINLEHAIITQAGNDQRLGHITRTQDSTKEFPGILKGHDFSIINQEGRF